MNAANLAHAIKSHPANINKVVIGIHFLLIKHHPDSLEKGDKMYAAHVEMDLKTAARRRPLQDL
jgi:hypothetical protein